MRLFDKHQTVSGVLFVLLMVCLIAWLMVLLPGCSAGRQGKLHRETVAETHTVRTDSLLLQDLFRASRNKTVDIEHIVFDTCRWGTLPPDSCPITTLPPIHSVTRIAINEQGEVEAKASVISGMESSSRSVASESLQKEQAMNLSSGKWGFVLLMILFLLVSVKLK